MQFACIVVLFIFAPAVFGQRFISGPEEEGRLLTPKEQQVLRSSACPDSSARVTLRAKIDDQGRVTQVNEVKQRAVYSNHSQSRLRTLMAQAKNLVLTVWRYRPLMVDGRATAVSTYISVRCTPQ